MILFSLTYLNLVFDRKVISTKTWHDVLESAVIPALRDIDLDSDGIITIRELLKTVKRIIITALA